VLLRMGASSEDTQPPCDRRLPQPLRLELNPGKHPRRGSNPRVADQHFNCRSAHIRSRSPDPSPTSHELCMICLQIPGGRGHEAAEGSRVGIGRAGHGGEPHEICEEGGDRGKGAESDAGGGGATGACEDGEDARRRGNQEKRKRSHSGDTDFASN
jgi:hypothetical protein